MQGLRDQEYDLQKTKNTFRVVVVGDSYTMPAGVSIEDAYHTLLEEEIGTGKLCLTDTETRSNRKL